MTRQRGAFEPANFLSRPRPLLFFTPNKNIFKSIFVPIAQVVGQSSEPVQYPAGRQNSQKTAMAIPILFPDETSPLRK